MAIAPAFLDSPVRTFWSAFNPLQPTLFPVQLLPLSLSFCFLFVVVCSRCRNLLHSLFHQFVVRCVAMLPCLKFLSIRGPFVASVLVPVLESFWKWHPAVALALSRCSASKFFLALIVLCLSNPFGSVNILVAMFVQVVSASRF